MRILAISAAAVYNLSISCYAFSSSSSSTTTIRRSCVTTRRYSTPIEDGSTAEEAEAMRLDRLRAADEVANQLNKNIEECVMDCVGDDDNTNYPNEKEQERTDLKKQLYKLSASYDRGFGATPTARDEAEDIITQLAAVNPTHNPARGIDGDGTAGEDDIPLKGIWRMIWTSAYDVVSLGASPISTTSAIYQDISKPPVAINIIDFIPKSQSILPSSLSPPSLLRAEVATRASSRNVSTNDRVGLIFEGLKLQPIELLGQKVDNLPPLSIDFTWQRTLVEKLIELVPGLDKSSFGFSDEGSEEVSPDAPGYFDIPYVDNELLVIRQQSTPVQGTGGVFALIKVDSCEP